MAKNNNEANWWDYSWNGWSGCTKQSPGCDNCYAEALSNRFAEPTEKQPLPIIGKWGPGQPRLRTSESYWRQPVTWNRNAERGICLDCKGKGQVKIKEPHAPAFYSLCLRCKGAGKVEPYRARVFAFSLADVFDPTVDRAWHVDFWTLVRTTPNLDWLLVTKLPGAIPKILHETNRMRPELSLEFNFPQNAKIGVTAENQEWWDRRWPLALGAAQYWNVGGLFFSFEPLLGRIDVSAALADCGNCKGSGLAPTADIAFGAVGFERCGPCDGKGKRPLFDWAITGGESGAGARAMNMTHFVNLRTSLAFYIPVFEKQLGARPVWGAGADGDALLKNLGASFPVIKLQAGDKKGTCPDGQPYSLLREYPERWGNFRKAE